MASLVQMILLLPEESGASAGVPPLGFKRYFWVRFVRTIIFQRLSMQLELRHLLAWSVKMLIPWISNTVQSTLTIRVEASVKTCDGKLN